MARYSPYTRSFGGGIVNKTPSYQTTAIRGGGGGSGSSALYPQQDNTSAALQNLGGLLGFMYLTRDKDKKKEADAASTEMVPTENYRSAPSGTAAASHLIDEYARTGKTPSGEPLSSEPTMVPAPEESSWWQFFNGSPNFFNWNWGSLFGGN